LAVEAAERTIYPPRADIFAALSATPFDEVRVLVLGQDPYHGAGQAHGLAFSVRRGVKTPPSLRNIFAELEADLGLSPPSHGCLTPWAERGVLMLNAVLTVRAHEAASHAGRGWETFTDAVIRAVDDRPTPTVFVLWGGFARKKKKLVDVGRHTVIEGAHPSPLSVTKFRGSRPFSQVDAALRASGLPAMDWRLEP
jgi:uracil-DNA glycosylase